MFGEPCPITKKSAVFNLIWMYVIKELGGRRKARCTCDGSTRGGQVRVLDHTFANSIDQTGSRNFLGDRHSGESFGVWSRCVKCFRRSPTTKAGFLYQAGCGIQRMVCFSLWQRNSRRLGDPGPSGDARSSGMTKTLGKTLRSHSTKHRVTTNHP